MNGLRFIPTRVHGITDYLGGLLLLLAPELFGFSEVGGAAVWIPRILGALILGQALLTSYELGVFKILPMSAHLGMDYIVGLGLALSPFLFGFNENPANVWLPHVVAGAGIFLITVLTETEPRYDTGNTTLSASS